MREKSLFELLLGIDREAVTEARAGGCPHCWGRLDRSDFRRKPRGEPAGLDEEFSVRFSLCCGREGCRRRLTPFSVRYLGRKVYVGVAVVLVAAALQGLSETRERWLGAVLGVTRRTASRWLAWWRGSFAESTFYRGLAGRLRKALKAEELPEGLLAATGQEAAEAAVTVLRLLRPITSATAPGAHPV